MKNLLVVFGLLFLFVGVSAQANDSMAIGRLCTVKAVGSAASTVGINIGDVIVANTSTYAEYKGPFKIHNTTSFLKISGKTYRGNARYEYDDKIELENIYVVFSSPVLILKEGGMNYAGNSPAALYVRTDTKDAKIARLTCKETSKRFFQSK